jgi:two-component system, sensor histidine kinase and response regulator
MSSNGAPFRPRPRSESQLARESKIAAPAERAPTGGASVARQVQSEPTTRVAEAVTLPPVPSEAHSLRGSRVLIVDDDRLNTRILRSILEGEGCTVACSDSGEAAVALYETFKPDLLLLDVMMPGMDGFQACRELRRRHGVQTAPVIFITAKAESDDVVAGFNAGGVDYLPKPFRPNEALARIRTHLHNRHLLQQLKAADAAKNRFLGMCAHDLRNPLASIRGLAEFLQDPLVGALNAEQKELAHNIQTTAQSMLQLVNELLDVAIIEAGELRLDRKPADLRDLVARSVSLASFDAARKETRIEFQLPPPAPAIQVDAEKIRQVLSNLLSNAVKFSPPGSRIRIRFEADPEQQSFTVFDQGPGIPEGEHSLLFKNFGRLSTRPTGGEKSTGLGLAICRKIVAAHGGTIGAQNQREGGCAFTVTLPMAP